MANVSNARARLSRMRRVVEWLLRAVIVIFGAVLRFNGLAVPSLWLDEILDYDVATKLTHEPLWRWLTGFASEHGPLFFASELAGRFAHPPEFAARFGPALFGVAAILVACFASEDGALPSRRLAWRRLAANEDAGAGRLRAS